MNNKTCVAILFGGRSAEHDVSLQSACNVIKSLDQNQFDPLLIGIDRQGRWYAVPNPDNFSTLTAADLTIHEDLTPVALVPVVNQPNVINLNTGAGIATVAVLFPVLHGPYGEDGSVQGLARLSNIACVGAGIAGSAMGMDKDVMKRLLSQAGIPNAPGMVVHHNDPRPNMQALTADWGWPLFIKPANLGSSVGITKVDGPKDFDAAIAHAFAFDQKIIIEKAIVGRELEVAVLGNDNPIASAIGEIIPTSGFYSYDSKYIDEDTATLAIPAVLSDDQVTHIQRIALDVFRLMNCEGLARIDLFMTAKGALYINEINTLPGFTNISMYPKLWEYSGLPQRALVTKLIELALEKHLQRSALKTVR